MQRREISSSSRAFIVLTKPEITFMVMISAGVASLMAAESLRIMVLVHTVVGIGLLAAGASALNQYLERHLDGRMRRTARRPLPAKDLTARQALIFGVAVSSAGLLYVFLLLNTLTALLGLLTLISYLFIYTPLKTKTSLCTFVGAFPGAAPVLMGWSATTNSLTLEAAGLYAILFLWQFPHFFAIGWLYREDYKRAGMLMLPTIDTNDKNSSQLILIFTHLLIIASVLLTVIAHTGMLYLVAAIILGICFYPFAYQASLSASKLAAKRLLHASVIYLPLLYLFMLLDKVIR
ncbi:MAG TPA: heme o synthase [Pyrinomonadaceae bacterium]|nr:heme o synthase [Pyrinomonadaceae bacterium]